MNTATDFNPLGKLCSVRVNGVIVTGKLVSLNYSDNTAVVKLKSGEKIVAKLQRVRLLNSKDSD